MDFETWVKKFDKKYDSCEEYAIRREIFNEKQKERQRHNKEEMEA